MKPWYLSTTIWLNIFMLLVWLGVIYFSMTDLPAVIALLGSLLSGMNISLRLVTNRPINISITKGE